MAGLCAGYAGANSSVSLSQISCFIETFSAKNRNEWRKWLHKHHLTLTEIHLVYYKVHTCKASISYSESVDEALCYGWIDGVRKSVDEERYMIRFTPRKPNSVWSKINTKKVEQMIAEGKMLPIGLEKVAHAQQNGQWDAAYSLKEEKELPPDFKKALNKNKKALENYNKFSNTTKSSCLNQINAVKSKEARAERIKKMVELLEQNIKPYINGKRALSIYK
jgi:uncharacterized protein YdeI (YjbR/CyaY-like superfamily)